MNILLIGASKFIGSHLLDRLIGNDEIKKVTYTYFSQNYFEHHKERKISYSKCDVTDPNNITDNIFNAKAEIIVYMASSRYFPEPKDRNDHANININGMKNLVKSCKEYKKNSKVIFLNSGASKLNLENKQFDYGSYAKSKKSASEIFNSSKNKGDINGTELNLYTPYGPKDYSYRLIQSSVIEILNGRLPKLNNPNSHRDFIYIDDVIDVLEKVILSRKNFESIDVGTSKSTSNQDVLKEIYKVMNIEKNINLSKKINTEQITHMKADLAVAKNLLNWEPKTDIKNGIYNTVNWIKENYKNYYE